MKREKLYAFAACLTLLGLLAGSCAPAAGPAPTAKAPAPSSPAPAKAAQPTATTAAPAATPKPLADQPRYGGILTVGIGGDPVSFDIHREESAFTYAITSSTYDGLLKYDSQAWPEFKSVPNLATSWQVSPDGKVYTFNLVKGAKFHSGAPVTAEDVKFSFDRIRDPQLGLVKSPRRQNLANVANIDAPDDSTVRITLKNPQASLISLISTLYFMVYPKSVVLEKKGDMMKTVAGSGPFKLKDYATGVGWELVKNPDYFVKGRPYLDGAKGYIILDSFTRFAALRTRSILWISPYPYMSVSQTKIIAETLADKIAVGWEFHPAWYGILFNTTRPPWSDVRVRQAVSLTFDRKKMVAVGLEGAGIAGMAAQPPGEWALPEEEMAKVPGYAKPELEAAKKLMAEAGFPNGFTAEALVRGVKPHQDMALLAKDAVAAIGVTLNLKVVETAIYDDVKFRKAFEVNPLGWGSVLVDPDVPLGDFYVTGSPRNPSGYSNPYYDELYVKQSRTLDAAERRKTVWEMQRILLKDIPIAIAYWANAPYAWWKEVRGFKPPVIFFNAFGYHDIWLAR
ncbi:MAG: ABC transporter substrate-binding protein [Chloroflexi bacterium]|nr:ABC transporter substrate-binding protein [Chloroflexota bacterium]